MAGDYLQDPRTGQLRGSRAGARRTVAAPVSAPVPFPGQAPRPGTGGVALADPGTVDELRAVLKADHPGLVLHLHGPDSAGFVTLSLISVPADQRGTGVASRVMERLTAAADRNGWPLALTPDASFGASKARLVAFYRRFGFVPNTGRSRDFTTREAMIRHPQT